MSFPPERLCETCGNILTQEAIICPYCGHAAAPSRFVVADRQFIAPNRQRSQNFWKGILAGSLGGGVTLWADIWLVYHRAGALHIIAAAESVAVPIVFGILGAFFWRRNRPSASDIFGYSTVGTLIALILGGIVLREGSICLLMASPIVLLFVWVGALVGNAMFRPPGNRMRLAVAPLLLIYVVADSIAPHAYRTGVVDRVVVHATPAEIWRYIPDYPPIKEPPAYWLWRIGLPYPVTSTTSGHYTGARRECRFAPHLDLDERMTVFNPGREMTFRLIHQPSDPEIVGHLSIDRGQFLLAANPDGTTTMTGTTWYNLHVYPVCYYNLWAADIVRHVHLRVMSHIKMLAEHDDRIAHRTGLVSSASERQ